jgi:hypothetical protein
MKSKERKDWSTNVVNQLNKVTDLKNDEFILLAGEKYRQFILPHINNYKIPLEGLKIGQQLSWLNQNINIDLCDSLHKQFNALERLSFPFNKNKIPKNGIYILFEKGETCFENDRVVRVGTHTGEAQLYSRLQQHFLNEKKDRSIFRKNIGRAILNKNKDPFIDSWEKDLTTGKMKEEYFEKIDLEYQQKIEKEVTKFIQDNFSFVVFRVDDKKTRLELESKIISTISLCNNCKPSKNWLGNFSTKEKIIKSGLWLVNELWKTPLSKEDMNILKTHFK